MKIKRLFIIAVALILLVIVGIYNFMSTGPEKIPAILQNQEGIGRVNKEAKELWDNHMVNLTNVKTLNDSELNSYPLIASLGETVWLYSSGSNIPARIEARTSKNRNVRFIFIFKPGTAPQWDKPESTIKIDSNIFILHSSGWRE